MATVPLTLSSASLRSTHSIGLSSSKCRCVYFLSPDLTRYVNSKKSKVQSHALAPAILEGLMPIATEDEPQDIDDDAPSRVRLLIYLHFRC